LRQLLSCIGSPILSGLVRFPPCFEGIQMHLDDLSHVRGVTAREHPGDRNAVLRAKANTFRSRARRSS